MFGNLVVLLLCWSLVRERRPPACVTHCFLCGCVIGLTLAQLRRVLGVENACGWPPAYGLMEVKVFGGTGELSRHREIREEPFAFHGRRD
ncbi:hypothetical protein SODALDRAFT_334331, partial [Sodiomyces alkalinus F11]